MTDIIMPQLGETVSEGTVSLWLRQVGDTVAADDPLLEISTDKVDTEIPSPTAGTITEILVAEGDTVPVGTLLARLRPPGESASPETAKPGPQVRSEEPKNRATQPVPPPALVAPTRSSSTPFSGQPPIALPPPFRPRLSPLVRRLSTTLAVDPTVIRGTGANGRVTATDLRSATRQRSTDQPDIGRPADPRLPAASLTCVVEVDVSDIAHLDEKTDADAHSAATASLLVIAAAAVEAITAHPDITGKVGNPAGRMRGVALGIVVDTVDGQSRVAVIPDAHDLNVQGLGRALDHAATLSDSATADQGGSTGPRADLVIVNAGGRGLLFETPALHPAAAAALSVGAITRRPTVLDDPRLGTVTAVRHHLYLALSFDSGRITGVTAARFLSTIRERLENPRLAAELAAQQSGTTQPPHGRR